MVSKGLRRAYRQAKANQRETGGYVIYQIKKDGSRYAKPYTAPNGRITFTQEQAKENVARMIGYNPGTRYDIVEA